MKSKPVLILLASALLWSGCGPKREAAEEKAAAKVEGEQVVLDANAPQRGALSVEPAAPRKATTTVLTGRLVWNEEATVRVFSPVGGRVLSIPVNLGQTVTAGELLARIASPDYGQAQADLRKAQADLTLAERNLGRLQELFSHGAAARKDVEAAEDAQANAVSEKDRAAARLLHYGGSAEIVDEVFALKAPMAGVVVERNVTPGQEVRPDQMLANAPNLFAPQFVISDPARLWLWLDVTEMDMAAFKPGLALKIHTKAYPDRVFDGRVESVGDSLDPSTRTVKVRGVVDNAGKLLKAEMYVTAEVMLDAPGTDGNAVDVSTKAVFLRNNRHYLFIEQAPGHYERKRVRLGAESNGRILVLEGVSPGQHVVTEGCLLLQAVMDAGAKS